MATSFRFKITALPVIRTEASYCASVLVTRQYEGKVVTLRYK